MPKDFATSYEQMRWKHAADAHARLCQLRDKYAHNPAFSSFMRRIDELEKEYPILAVPVCQEASANG